MAKESNTESNAIQKPDVVGANLFKDKQKNWVLNILTSDERKLRIKPTQKDLKEYFSGAKGKTKEETSVLLIDLGKKYLDKALALPQNNNEEESIDMPNRSAEDKAFDLFTEQLIEKLETIQADWKKPWFTEGALGWPKNLSGRSYNGMNAFVLMLNAEKKNYKLPVWVTFDRVASLNYQKTKQGKNERITGKDGEKLPTATVLKGEKSVPVFITTFSVVDLETREKVSYEDYRQMSEDQRARFKVFPKLQVYQVFNVAQTNIEQARPDLYQKLVAENTNQRPERVGEDFIFPEVDAMIADNKWICPIKPTHGDDAYYSISRNEIVVPEKSQFIDGESFYSNLFHEMAHSTGAEKVLNRLKPASFGSKEYGTEELVAELSAAIVSQKNGLHKHVKEDSMAYLKSWLNSLKEEPSFIKTVLLDVKKASQMINQHIEKMQLELGTSKEQGIDDAKEQKQQEKKDDTVQETVTETVAAKSAPSAKETYQNLEEIGTYDIPEWSLSYLQNGDADGLDDEEIELVDKFVKEKMQGKAFIMVVDWDNPKDFNNMPEFGTRNPYASPQFGESPYQAVKTYGVTFLEATRRVRSGEQPEERAAKFTPKEEPKEEIKDVTVKEEVHVHRSR